jgi:hypothetical protein
MSLSKLLSVNQEPNQEKYQTELIVSEEEILSPLVFPEVAIAVVDLLPKVLI